MFRERLFGCGGIGCVGVFLAVAVGFSIILFSSWLEGRDPAINYTSQDPDEIVFYLSWFLLEHDDKAYDLVDKSLYPQVEAWFHSTTRLDCHAPGLTSGPGYRPPQINGDLASASGIGVLCYNGSTPVCDTLRFGSVELEKITIDSQDRWIIQNWQEPILCYEDKHRSNILQESE